jgi:hypothetical protein
MNGSPKQAGIATLISDKIGFKPKVVSKIHHILCHKASLNKYKKTEIIAYLLSDHNAVKIKFNNKRNSRKCSHNWKLNNMLLYDD